MTSALPATTCDFLRALGFDYIKADRHGLKETWLSQEALPHIQILLDPAQRPVIIDIVRAIYSAGATDQRDLTRTAWNRCADTFRNGQPVQSPDDILSLSDSASLPISPSPSL